MDSKMDPNPNNFPILSYVMSKIPSIGPRRATGDEFDVEQPPPVSPKPQQPYFELTERMPHLTDPKVVSAMRLAVADVAQTRAVLRDLGQRPDHEAVDTAKAKLAEIESELSRQLDEIALSPRPGDEEGGKKVEEPRKAALEEDRKIYKAVISLDEMHEAYEKMLTQGEERLEKIYEAAVTGGDLAAIEKLTTEKNAAEDAKEEVNEAVMAVMQEASEKAIERVKLSDKNLKIVPEAFFSMLRSLIVLDLSHNHLEAIPDTVSGLEKLEELNLSSNLLESLPDSIGLLFNLKILDVSKNKLTVLPDSICHCRSLVELDASFNKLGYLPTNIGLELSNLRRLSIQLNKIRSLPTSICEMKSLQLLDAHFNELHGLPLSIGKLTNLEILNLSSNFTDLNELPYTIGDLNNLKELDVSNNQIHELPDTFGRLENLTKLNVDQNPLVIPPKEIVNEGVEAVKAYMVKRRLDILLEEQRMGTNDDQSQSSLLNRSTSWLNNFVANVSGYLGAESPKKAADPALNQQY